MRNLHAWRILKGFLRSLISIAVSVAALGALVCGLIVLQGQRDEARQSGAAIVLGAAQWNGDPSPVLRARLDHALDLYRRGLVSRIILTGGVGRGDRLSEAAAGKQYLIEQRLPAEALLLDERSTTTWENLRNAAALARANGINSVLLVSDPFHMLRSLKMARDLGLAAYGSPTRTSPISVNWTEEARYIVRESWAYLVYLVARQ
ncbi:MAG TPA: YdcF family protein [Roseiflexaceae bacterium]